MITRIEVDGFKSLRDFAVDLEPLTAIVGPNGVGKSNLFDALQLLSGLADTDVVTALGEGRGGRLDQFARAQGGDSTRIKIGTELLLEGSGAAGSAIPQSRFRHRIELARVPDPSGVEKLVLQGESLEAIQHASDAWLAKHPSLATFARYDDPEISVQTIEDRISASPRTLRWRSNLHGPWTSQMMGSEGTKRSFLAFPPGLGPPPLVLESVGEALRGFRFLRLEPSPPPGADPTHGQASGVEFLHELLPATRRRALAHLADPGRGDDEIAPALARESAPEVAELLQIALLLPAGAPALAEREHGLELVVQRDEDHHVEAILRSFRSRPRRGLAHRRSRPHGN